MSHLGYRNYRMSLGLAILRERRFSSKYAEGLEVRIITVIFVIVG